MKLQHAMSMATPSLFDLPQTPFQELIKSSVKGTKFVPHGIVLGAQCIESSVADKRVLTQSPIRAIRPQELIDGDAHKSGRYLPESRTILMRENIMLRLIATQVFMHEFGHHLHHTFINDVSLDANARREYNHEHERAEAYIGEPIPDSIDDVFSELYRVGCPLAPSLYSLRSFDEWVAESFDMVFTGFGDALKTIAPATWAFIDLVISGKIL